MSKNKKRKQRKAKHKFMNQKTRRRLAQRVDDALGRFFELAGDERIPPEEAARAFLSVPLMGPAIGELVQTLVEATSAKRALAIGEAAVRLEPERIGALTFAAHTAELAGDHRRTAELYTRALELGDGVDRELRWCRAAALISCNDGTATKQLSELCAEDPHDDLSEALYCDALEAAAERMSLGHEEPCPCGSGLSYGSCGFELDRDALADFRDRSQLEKLWSAVDEYSRQPRYAHSIEELRARFFNGEHVEPSESMNDLLRPWIVALTGSKPDDDSDEPTIFWDFTRDEDVDPELGLTALLAASAERWGLWQLGPRRGPGVWLRDLVSASSHFVAVGTEISEGHSPWTVFLGPLTPNRGRWHAHALIPLTPDEGDTLADAVLEFADTVVAEDDPKKKSAAAFIQLVDDGPPGAIVTRRQPLSPDIGLFLTHVLSGVLPLLLEELGRMRAKPLALQNTDGEPLEFFSVHIEVADLDLLQASLQQHPDIKLEDEEISWLGRTMTPSEAATSRAELEAYAEREGVELMDPPDEAPRYTRAFIKIVDGELVTEVNSAGRLDGLIALLEEAGAQPRVTSKVRIDPAMDWPVPGSVEPTDDRGMSAEAIAAWQEAWLDEEVPALGGLTPRKAAEDDYGRLDLESLLRTFEYRAAQQRAEGRVAVDVEWLRTQLGMEQIGAP
jgi:hypothetical protein